MGYIYLITNDINQKQYVGQTQFSLEKRFKEHIIDAFKVPLSERPLYRAIRKYGVQHFHIQLLEETENLAEREQYWIKYYNTYNNGYNATIGGEGKNLFNHQQIIELYKQHLNCTIVAKIIGSTIETVSDVLKSANIQIIKPIIGNKPVIQYDKNNNYIQTFNSCGIAAQYLIKNNIAKGNINSVTAKISGCARQDNHRKTAYHFIWRYASQE